MTRTVDEPVVGAVSPSALRGSVGGAGAVVVGAGVDAVATRGASRVDSRAADGSEIASHVATAAIASTAPAAAAPVIEVVRVGVGIAANGWLAGGGARRAAARSTSARTPADPLRRLMEITPPARFTTTGSGEALARVAPWRRFPGYTMFSLGLKLA